ncbi:ABC transporter substrate-binding protein [Bauldia sp.]|uniref:ABC transporter substrate-binding protein n=1 Tax=Bauldia sp. TaxID=2575872 RepID=UPI003BAB2877
MATNGIDTEIPASPARFGKAASMIAAALFATCLALPASAEDTNTRVSFGLNWLPQGEHCGFYQALATGLYEDAGLDVELQPGGPDINVPNLVAAGTVDLGMGSSFTSLNAINQGIPLVTVAAFLQKDPQTLVAHGGQGVSTLEDLKDRPVMIAKFSQFEFWQFLKMEYGFSDDQIRPYTYSAAPFLADPEAVQQGYITEDALLLGAELPEPPVSIMLADYGYQNYASTAFTSQPFLDENPEVVRAFLAATAEGYRQCIEDDYTPAMEAVMAANPDHTAELFDFKLKQMRDREMVTGGDAEAGGVGAMTDARWQSFFDTMSAAGVYPADLDYADAYTLDYVGAMTGN